MSRGGSTSRGECENGHAKSIDPDLSPTESQQEPSEVPRLSTSQIGRFFLLSAAAVCFAVSVISIMVPLLPTTPFLLLTSYFLVRSSPKLNQALLKSRLFGPVLTDWQVHGGIRSHIRYRTIFAVLLVIGVTLYFQGIDNPIALPLIAAGILGIVVVMLLPNAR